MSTSTDHLTEALADGRLRNSPDQLGESVTATTQDESEFGSRANEIFARLRRDDEKFSWLQHAKSIQKIANSLAEREAERRYQRSHPRKLRDKIKPFLSRALWLTWPYALIGSSVALYALGLLIGHSSLAASLGSRHPGGGWANACWIVSLITTICAAIACCCLTRRRVGFFVHLARSRRPAVRPSAPGSIEYNVTVEHTAQNVMRACIKRRLPQPDGSHRDDKQKHTIELGSAASDAAIITERFNHVMQGVTAQRDRAAELREHVCEQLSVTDADIEISVQQRIDEHLATLMGKALAGHLNALAAAHLRE